MSGRTRHSLICSESVPTKRKRHWRRPGWILRSRSKHGREEKEEKQSRPPTESRRSWLEDIPINPFRSDSRPESPLLQGPQRTFSSDFLGIQSLSSKARKAPPRRRAPATRTETDPFADPRGSHPTGPASSAPRLPRSTAPSALQLPSLSRPRRYIPSSGMTFSKTPRPPHRRARSCRTWCPYQPLPPGLRSSLLSV